jgi:ATPase subunit of ABC transporter with duplicated ATPase domains
MAAQPAQYIFTMQGLTKAYPGGKKVFENIWLSFFPDAKIGVVGVNGSGKSTLMKIMAGMDKDFTGEAFAMAGTKMGYLPQEPQLDASLTSCARMSKAGAKKKSSSHASTKSA